MNDMTIFENPEFGRLRGLKISGEPWFVGKDVAAALGYVDTAQAIRKHVDDEDKGVVEATTPGGKQKITTINETTQQPAGQGRGSRDTMSVSVLWFWVSGVLPV